MNLIKIPQDFLILELKSNGLRYMYSSFDDSGPEILEFGNQCIPAQAWPELPTSWINQLDQIIAEKLPPFALLEAFLIAPEELTLAAEIRFPARALNAYADWSSWELLQTLPADKSGYSAEFGFDLQPTFEKIVEDSALAIRNRHLEYLSMAFRKRAVFISGIFLPQILWADLTMKISTQEIFSVIYRDNDACLRIDCRTGCFPKLKWYHQAFTEGGTDPEVFSRLTEDLAALSYSQNTGAGYSLFLFEKNLDEEALSKLQNVQKAEIKLIPTPVFSGISGSPEQSGYLLISQAQKKISELYLV